MKSILFVILLNTLGWITIALTTPPETRPEYVLIVYYTVSFLLGFFHKEIYKGVFGER